MNQKEEYKGMAGGVPVFCAHDAIVSVEEIKPNPRNPNHHPEEQIELLAKIIKAQGWRAPITVSTRSGFIVKGHGRLMACKKLGIDTVPVVRLDHLTDEQRREYAIAHNATAELSVWESVNLAEELSELDLSAFDFNFPLIAEEEPDAEEDNFDVDSATPEEPKAKLGQVYQLGRHRLMCGDSTSTADVQMLVGGGTSGYAPHGSTLQCQLRGNGRQD